MMAMSQAVYIKSGDQPKGFVFGNPTAPAGVTTVVQASLPIYKESVYATFQAIVLGTGAVTGTVVIQCTNDDNTGRGFILGGGQPGNPGGPIQLNTSVTVNSQGGQFTPALLNALVVAPGVPVGTTVAAVAADGRSLTLSAAATASGLVQGNFFANNWCTTALGTITLTGTNSSSDGFTTQAPWRYVRANVTAITGTGASLNVLMGV